MICFPDFDSDDFNDFDYRTSVWGKRLNDFLFYLFPDYFKQNDSYKDSNGRGILERYMYIMGEELDNNLVPYIECQLDTMYAGTTEDKFIDHIADSFKVSRDLFKSNEQYKNLLSTIISLRAKRNTQQYIEMYFYILGYDITITKIPIDTSFYSWDSGASMDDEGNWDDYSCLPCFEYSADLTPNANHGGETIDVNEENKLKGLLESQAPINSKLNNFNIN